MSGYFKYIIEGGINSHQLMRQYPSCLYFFLYMHASMKNKNKTERWIRGVTKLSLLSEMETLTLTLEIYIQKKNNFTTWTPTVTFSTSTSSKETVQRQVTLSVVQPHLFANVYKILKSCMLFQGNKKENRHTKTKLTSSNADKAWNEANKGGNYTVKNVVLCGGISFHIYWSNILHNIPW